MSGARTPVRFQKGKEGNGDDTPKSPGGSVLNRVQMFEAHNAHVKTTSPEFQIALKKKEEQKNNVIEERKYSSSHVSMRDSSRTEQMDHFEPKYIDASKGAHRTSSYHENIRSEMKVDLDMEEEDIPMSKSNRNKEYSASQGQQYLSSRQRNMTDEEEEDEFISSSERRRKIMMAKRKVANARSDHRLRSAFTPISGSPETPDPLDREGQKKKDVNLNSPRRERKFKMVEASMKKNLHRGPGSVKTDASSTVSNNSLSTYYSTDGEKNIDNMIHLERALPTIKSNERSSYTMDQEHNVNGSPFRRQGSQNEASSVFEYSSASSTGNSEYHSKSPVRQNSNNLSFFQHDESAKNVYQMSEQHNSGVSSMLPNQGKYFAPNFVDGTPTSAYDDGDDDTQFNSVTMQDFQEHHNKQKESPYHYSSPSPKGSEASSKFFGGSSHIIGDEFKEISFQSQNKACGTEPQQNDDDADSYTDSVTTGSWTGRMRARKAMEQSVSPSQNPARNVNSFSNLNSQHYQQQNYDDNMSVTERVYNSVQKQQKAVMSDAKEGFDNVITEDPTNVAVGVGVVGALCGSILLGPPGILLAVVGAGAGYKFSQMPEEDRSKVTSKASTVMQKIHDSAIAANESISTSCVACANQSQQQGNVNASETRMKSAPTYSSKPLQETSENASVSSTGDKNARNIKLSNIHIKPKDVVPSKISDQSQINATRLRQIKRLSPACQRMSRITPVAQIHSLDPSLHPRAWLDVMSSAWTSRDEKNEAMEEILLLAKDKSHSRMLLDEGILDSLMYILRKFFLHYADVRKRNADGTIPTETYMSDPNYFHSKLASNCCVALAKAHCALSHNAAEEQVETNVHMTVPIAKQVAQMLYEVPHHMVLKTDGTEGENKEVFKLTTEMSTQQAEDLALSIVSLSMGKIEIRLQEV